MMLQLDSIKKVFFCTGARNQELLKTFNAETLCFEYDERMASFKALGLTKISKHPVIICTTSGTAAAECVPAMLEAFYSKLPLILITGDRPKKLHGTGSPQTIDHEALTRSCRGTYLEMTFEDFKNLRIENPLYPIHINVLVDDTVAHSKKINTHTSITSFENFIQDKKHPLFLFSHEEKSMRPFIEAFKQTGLPFYAETLSGGRDLSSITDERALLKFWNEGRFDSVIRVGFTPLSKIWRQLEKKTLPVFNFDSRGLPGLSYGEVLPWPSERLIQEEIWWKALPKPDFKPEADKKLMALIDKYPHSEISCFKRLHDSFKEHDLVYLGNSLVIRFFELVQNKCLNVHGNRGVNGIDGQLATAIGMAMGTTSTVYCILGDITTLYDLSSMREMPSNLKLIIMNNQGGRIFDMLKLDKRIVLEHNTGFKEISQGFGLTYSNSLKDLNQVQVLELNPIQLETEEFLKEWNT